jgi:hypothetical protein
VGCVQARVSEWSLSTLPSPIQELQHAPLPLKVLWTRKRGPIPPSSTVFYLDPRLGPLRSWECVSPCQDCSNGMSHTTCTQGNRGDSWFLVVGSQIVNLTPAHSLGHNLCFTHPNGSCKLILNIDVPRAFQWYKERLNPMVFDPWNCFLKIWKSIETPTPEVGTHLGVWGFIPSHSPTFSRAWDATLGLPFWPAPLQAFALVVSPRLGLRHLTFVWPR